MLITQMFVLTLVLYGGDAMQLGIILLGWLDATGIYRNAYHIFNQDHVLRIDGNMCCWQSHRQGAFYDFCT